MLNEIFEKNTTVSSSNFTNAVNEIELKFGLNVKQKAVWQAQIENINKCKTKCGVASTNRKYK